jgi:hypothetical protein
VRNTTTSSPLICSRCKGAVEPRLVPFGKTTKYIEVIGCRCVATRYWLKFDNTKFRYEDKRSA